jgi:hypothetical protein
LCGFAVKKQHAIGDLLGTGSVALVYGLASDSQALADLVPRGRRDTLGGDRQAQNLLGLPDEWTSLSPRPCASPSVDTWLRARSLRSRHACR